MADDGKLLKVKCQWNEPRWKFEVIKKKIFLLEKKFF